MERKRIQAGHKIGLLVMATGVGKTIVSALDIERELRQANEKNESMRVLFLVHTEAIKLNALSKFKRHFSETFPDSAFLNHNSSKALPSLKNVVFVFALFQSMSRLLSVDWTHVIVDEVHHCVAPSYRSVVASLLHKVPYVLGMTATRKSLFVLFFSTFLPFSLNSLSSR